MSRVETRRRHEASVDDDIALLDELRRLGSACSKCRRRRNSCCGCARRRTTPWCGRRRFSTACSRPAYRVEAGRRQSMKASPAIVVRVQQALRAQGHVVPGLRPEQLVRRPISGGVGPARGTKRFVHRARRRRSRQRQHHKVNLLIVKANQTRSRCLRFRTWSRRRTTRDNFGPRWQLLGSPVVQSSMPVAPTR